MENMPVWQRLMGGSQINKENQRQMSRKHDLFMSEQYTGGCIGICFNVYMMLHNYNMTWAYHVLKSHLGNVVTNKKPTDTDRDFISVGLLKSSWNENCLLMLFDHISSRIVHLSDHAGKKITKKDSIYSYFYTKVVQNLIKSSRTRHCADGSSYYRNSFQPIILTEIIIYY